VNHRAHCHEPGSWSRPPRSFSPEVCQMAPATTTLLQASLTALKDSRCSRAPESHWTVHVAVSCWAVQHTSKTPPINGSLFTASSRPDVPHSATKPATPSATVVGFSSLFSHHSCRSVSPPHSAGELGAVNRQQVLGQTCSSQFAASRGIIHSGIRMQATCRRDSDQKRT
jgi:hypothetical protein